MEEIKRAAFDLDSFLTTIEGVAGLSYILWESMAEGSDTVKSL